MKDKEQNILNWIKEQGYPFEMYCKTILSRHGFTVMQSIHYEDLETNKSREMDILATKFKVVNGVTFNISLVIECKTSKEKPWLIFTYDVDKNKHSEIIDTAYCTKNAKDLIQQAAPLKKFSLFQFNPDSVGFNITQCFTQGKDIPFESVTSTSKACEYLVKKSIESFRPFCNFYFPVVAIDSDFYKCSSDEQSEIALNSTDIEQLITVKSYADRKYILHNIITKSNFEKFSKNLSAEIDILFKSIESEMHQVSVKNPGTTRLTIQ